jgi:hypothetical protein
MSGINIVGTVWDCDGRSPEKKVQKTLSWLALRSTKEAKGVGLSALSFILGFYRRIFGPCGANIHAV